jgi:hypothetical protein
MEPGKKSGKRPNSGSSKREQVNKLDGRPVRARTADLHRVKVGWTLIAFPFDSRPH